MKNLLFISTSSLAANPRLVKEFEALKHTFACHVLCFKHHDWSLELSETIKARNPEIHFIEIDRKKEIIKTVFSKVLQKFAIVLNPFFPTNFGVCAFASNDKALQLWFMANALQKNSKFSRIIAHNLGAFYASVKLSEKNDIALQLDVEDYYPGEALYFNKAYEKQNRMKLMAHSFLRAESVSYASKGIQLECEKHFKGDNQIENLTIINSFNAEDFKKPGNTHTNIIKCVWFSQHIGPNRGLEKVFAAAKSLDRIEFHLIGNPNYNYLETVSIGKNVMLHDIMKQEDLHEFLSQMDIGLALENVEADDNRNICLTNKFLAYVQAGLYILATDTFGQSQFLSSLDYNAGLIMEFSLEKSLQDLDRNLIQTTAKVERWQNARSFSWENEQLKLQKLVS
ncbi:hypothetical protein JM79_2894 [Gramella sp. Hel_I_59]|uniref:glycosyltransferase family 4 protein n=1 Tax=Gramella sp. Hel_I_59 TaxID=1249978 RepID=UPI001151BAB5|nr:glycosyltransferase family 4 protein [Gramella sp. Hel_I_59]TQI71943.1 hypothetical protein JM79_2894 [Gramella sp. Hel_I_59]